MENEATKRVLVVDSDSVTRDRLKDALEQRGLVTDDASNGGDALALVRENRYSVIIVDHSVQSGGVSIVEEIRRLNPKPMPVMLVLTEPARRQAAEALDGHLIHGLIRKPFDAHELAAVVDACSEIRGRMNLETMMLATLMAGGPLLS